MTICTPAIVRKATKADVRLSVPVHELYMPATLAKEGVLVIYSKMLKFPCSSADFKGAKLF